MVMIDIDITLRNWFGKDQKPASVGSTCDRRVGFLAVPLLKNVSIGNSNIPACLRCH
jgi:hypothetical protein